MTLKTAMDENVSAVFLDEDHFAERVRFQPAAGGIVREVVGLVMQDQNQTADQDDTHSQQETFWFLVLRDESHATKGGIGTVALGDILFRGTDPVPWTFQGEVRNVTDASWELQFSRNRPTRYGRTK